MRAIFTAIMLALAVPALAQQGASRGVQWFQSRDWAKAKAEFTSDVRRNDSDARAHFYLGRLALVDNDPEAAAEHLRRAVELADTLSDYHLWYGKAMSQQAMRAQNPMLALGVKAQLERAVALDGRSLDARDALADFYSMAPPMMGGGADKAREQAEAISRLDAMRGHFALGRIAIRSKDTTALEREMNAAIALAPDTLPAYSALANWYLSQKEWPKAFATLDRYVQRRPNDPYGLYGIGRVAATSGQELDRGERGLRAFVAKPPKDAANPVISLAYLRLGQVLDHQGKSADAHAAYQRALELDPRNEEARKAMK
jgi:tetratricopeptide (TPR) repeat protein